MYSDPVSASRALERGFALGGACRLGGGDAIVDIRADLGEAASSVELPIDVGNGRE